MTQRAQGGSGRFLAAWVNSPGSQSLTPWLQVWKTSLVPTFPCVGEREETEFTTSTPQKGIDASIIFTESLWVGVRSFWNNFGTRPCKCVHGTSSWP